MSEIPLTAFNRVGDDHEHYQKDHLLRECKHYGSKQNKCQVISGKGDHSDAAEHENKATTEYGLPAELPGKNREEGAEIIPRKMLIVERIENDFG